MQGGARGGPNVTIYDVADAAGVSIKTVSRVLNHEPNVSPRTQERVVAAVAALSYRPNISARSLAGSRSYLLGLLFDNPSDAYVSDVQLGALSKCKEYGYHLVIEKIEHESPDVRAAMDAFLSTLRIDGLILTPPLCDVPDILESLDQAGTPYVRIAPDREPWRAARVHMDDRRAAYEMTQYLLDLGHRSIGFIKGHPDHGASHLRYEGYRDALRSKGVELSPKLVRQGDFSFRGGAECAESLLQGTQRPTAIFASNDEMALGALSVANRVGLNVPRDISIAGFDDSPLCRITWPQLTTVRQPVAEMAAAAAEMLISRVFRGENEVNLTRLLDFEIIARETTTPAAGADFA